MENLIELITTEEKDAMDNYRWWYGTDDDSHRRSDHPVSIDDLLTVWEGNKQPLYKLLGNKLQISQEFEYFKDTFELEVDMQNIYQDYDSRFKGEMWDPELKTFVKKTHDPNIFRLAYFEWIDTEFPFLLYGAKESPGIYRSDHPYMERAHLRSMLNWLIQNKNIVTNECIYNFDIPMPNGKTLRVLKGQKVMRVLGKIANEYNLPGFEDFRICHSLVTNQKKIKGKITLSIHPLDYWTMSDNSSGWDSCMSWRNFGGYRSGTVEMMNSPIVVVAYLEAKDPMFIGSMAWSNKKWRQLFIVDPSTIMEIKEYPYVNHTLTLTILNWLKDLAEKNLGWKYDYNNGEYIPFEQGMRLSSSEDETRVCRVDVRPTGTMYCDIGTKDFHYAYFSNNIFGYNNLDIDYSGAWQCMWCGSTMNDSCGEQALLCYDCIEYLYCDCCNEIIYNDEYTEVNGHIYCSYCVDECCSECMYSGELYNDDSTVNYGLIYDVNIENTRKNVQFLLEDKDEDKCKIVYNYGESIIVAEENENLMLNDWLKEGAKPLYNSYHNYIYYSDLTEAAKNALGLYYDDLEEEDITSEINERNCRSGWLSCIEVD